MKRTLFPLLSLFLLSGLATLTSCQKEEGKNLFTATMEDCTDIRNPKTTLNGTALQWVDGDMVRIISAEGYGDYAATPQSPATKASFSYVSGTDLSAEGTDYRAYYPASINPDGSLSSVTLPALQTSEDGSLRNFPMAARSQNTSFQFKNLCGVLKLNLQKDDVTVTSIKLTVDKQINGPFYVRLTQDGSLDAYEYPDEYGEPDCGVVRRGTPGNAELNTVTLQCNQSINQAHDFYITLPQGTYGGLTLEITASDGSVCTKGPATGNVVIERSKYSTLTLAGANLDFVAPLPEGALPGLFTINEDGDQVRFSMGNLQYQASATTWRFAEKQWDYVGTQTPDEDGYYGGTVSGSDNRNIGSANYSGWIDLFGWGTGNNPTLISKYFNDYQTFVDWGSNAISNGGNAVNLWRTLSQSEWNYLFNNHQHCTGNVNGVGGVILLPDSWTLPEGCSFNSEITNIYTLSQWSAMEANGAVFLPAAGWRVTGVYHVGYYGNYWSSTPNVHEAYYMSFYGNYVFTWASNYREFGYSVRLVQNN